MDKKALRAEIREKKRAMTEAQIEMTSAALGEQLRNHPAYKEAKSRHRRTASGWLCPRSSTTP